MDLYWKSSIGEYTPDSLKDIDPLDSLGDGSGTKTLTVGDCALVVGYLNRVLFYKLKEQSGIVDNGYLQVKPRENAGDLYWDCQGITNDTLNVDSGTEFTWMSGAYPPEGFTLADPDIGRDNFQAWLSHTDQGYPSDYPYGYASGVYNDTYYLLYTSPWKWDIATGVLTSLGTVIDDHEFFDGPAYIESFGLILDFSLYEDKVHIFNMATEEYSFVVFPDVASYETRHGDDTYQANVGLLDKAYLVGGRDGGSTLKTGFTEYDPATNTWTALPNLPKAMAGPNLCPDIYNNRLMIIDQTGTIKDAYIYDIEAQTFDQTVPVFPYVSTTGWVHGGYNPTIERFIVPTVTSIISYDEVLDIWETHANYDPAIVGDPFVANIFDTIYGLISPGSDVAYQNVLRIPNEIPGYVTKD